MSEPEEWNLSLAAGPIFWCAFLLGTCLAIAAFPHRLNRWTAVSILLVPACGAFRTGKDLGPDDALNDIYLRFVIILTSHITFLSFCDAKPGTGLERKSGSVKDALLGGYKLVFNARGIGTSWEVPYLWPGVKSTAELHRATPAAKDEKKVEATADKSKLASRGRWRAVLIRAGYLLFNFLLISCYYDWLNPTKLLQIETAVDYAPEKASIVRRLVRQSFGVPLDTPVTRRELLIRANGAVANFVPDYLCLSAYHDFFAIFFIATGLDQSWEWPPLLGQVTEAYSMRRFWTMFWHKLVYRSFNSHAAVISKSIGINQRTTFSRLLNNYLVFLLSGIMHGAVAWQFGTKCAWKGSLKYWLLQPIAFVLEGAVQSLWGIFRRKLSWVRPSVLSAFERTVGYAWVCAWLLWEAPKRSSTFFNCKT